MSDFSIDVPHSVGEYSARWLIGRFLENLRHNPELTVHDSGTKLEGNKGRFSCSAGGFIKVQITGTIEIRSDCVVVNGNVPEPALDRVEGMLRKNLTKLFDLQPWKPRLPLPYPHPRR